MRSTVRLANDAWEALLSAHAVLLKEFLAEDLWCEISMREYDVLYTLAKAGGPIRIGDLQEHVLLSQPALSRLVDRLVGRGLVQRDPDPSDARVVLISLTASGRDIQRAVGRRHARHVAAAMTERLGTGALEELENLCGRLAGHRSGPEVERS
jgi:DNA-binding MarR family transcriptional regulator